MTTPDPTLRPELLDELLSADLDGEFDRAATELGYTPAEARAALESTPGATGRRAALARARDQLGARPELGEADEERLVASALDRGTPDRARRRRAERGRQLAGRALAAVGSAAAVIAVIFALAAGNHGGSSKSAAVSAPEKAATASSPRAAVATTSGRPVAFGDVSHASALRRQVKAALNAAPLLTSPVPTTYAVARGTGPAGTGSSQGPTGAATPSATGVDSSKDYAPQGPQGLQGDGLLAAAPRGLIGADGVVVNGPLSFATAPTAPPTGVLAPLTTGRCVAAGARAAGLRSAPALTGSGTYAGQPAVVVVFGRAQAYVAYVLSVPGCSVITHVAVP